MTLEPPSPYAVYTPAQTHPSRCEPSSHWELPRYNFRHLIRAATDPVYAKKRETPQRGLQWADYLTLRDEQESLRPSMLAFFADCFLSYPMLLPSLSTHRMYAYFTSIGATEVNSLRSWMPTIAMTLEFKFPLPKPTDPHRSQRTVAIFTQSKFVNEPNARHDSTVELWTAPSNVGDGAIPADDGWKEHQRCLAVSTQMALVIPAAVNRKQGARVRL